jgi:TolB protein
MIRRLPLLTLAAVLAPVAHAQPTPSPTPTPTPTQGGLVVDVEGGISAPMGIAIPPMPTSEVVSTPAGPTDALGHQLADVITGDLKNSGLFKPLPAGQLLAVPFAEATSPNYGSWSAAGATALVQGYVRANGNGTLTVGCYLYDTAQQRELARQGYIVPFGEWRRAAHKCADMVYTRLTGEGPYFDSRVVYVSETGPKGKRIKRLALMDQDGFNGRFLTNGQTIVLTPTLSRDQRRIAYLSYLDKKPTIYVYDIASGRQTKLVTDVSLAFAPRFSPNGQWILFSMAQGGNTDLYRIPSGGGQWQRLTTSPGIDTGGSYSPDGNRIVFESDRSGAQQLYVMNADGSNQQRISFGNGRYATPAWSPRGDLIAFTKMGGGFHVGIMSPSGGGEKMLTDGWQDEAPSWAPNGRVIMFFRSTEGGSGGADLWSVDLTGVNERRLPTPFDGSDPSWGPIRTD